MSLLLLTGLACARPLPDMAPAAVPAPVTVPMVSASGELDPKSTAAAGFFKAKSGPADQGLSWEPATEPLAEATAHERLLVFRALGQDPPADLPALTKSTVAGQAALNWTVDGGRTRFVGTSFQCGELRVEISTYGDAALPKLVDRIHAASLAGAKCEKSAG